MKTEIINQDRTSSPEYDEFEIFLSAQLQQAQPYMMDDSFTAQLMAKLPAAKKLSPWQERLIIAVPLVIISLLVLSQFSVLALLIKLWTLFVVVDVTSLLQMGLVLAVAVVTGASLWFAKQF
jgi:hypothetical protein